MQEPSISAEAIEIPVSELQGFFDEMIQTYNALNDLLKDQGILRGRGLAELNTGANQAVKAEKSPIGKLLLLLNAYIRKQISHVRKALQARPPAMSADQGVIRQAISKIQLRALAIVEHVKTIAEGKEGDSFQLRAGQGLSRRQRRQASLQARYHQSIQES